MVKQDADDVKEEVKKQKEEFYGDEEMGSGSPSPDTDDDTSEMMEEVVGHEPKGRDTTIADEVEEAEEARRGVEPHEEEEKEEPETPELQ